jgi:hypothetical protein
MKDQLLNNKTKLYDRAEISDMVLDQIATFLLMIPDVLEEDGISVAIRI